MSLAAYIENKNFWRKMTKKPLLSLHSLKQEDVNSLAASMDCDMSPENLHCDGEISFSAAKAKARKIRKAFVELKAYVAKRNLVMPQTYEL